MMVGNSLADVLPAIAVGSWGVHIPHELTWALDHADQPPDLPRFRQLPDLGALPSMVETLD